MLKKSRNRSSRLLNIQTQYTCAHKSFVYERKVQETQHIEQTANQQLTTNT